MLLTTPQPSETELQPLRQHYVFAMEQFANDGMMLPEQVFDGVGNNDVYKFSLGEGTNGATPLAWSHAEYIKLLRSLRDRQVFDHYTPVSARYGSQK
jgi:glucoamylase